MLSLNIAVATHRPEGILRFEKMVLPEIPGVSYVVSWQNHDNEVIPDSLKRADIRIHRFDGIGQSANRNNALDHCNAEIVMNSDDDVTLYPEALKELRILMEENPEVDVATFRSEHGDMSRFPSHSVILGSKFPKGYHVSGIEIAFRKNRIGTLRFCTEFGLASQRLHGGEDEIFVYSAMRRGLHCRYFPVTICSHPHESTGTKGTLTKNNLMAQGCVIALMFPWTCILRIPLKAWRLSKKGRSGLYRGLRHLALGALMAPGVLRRNHLSMW